MHKNLFEISDDEIQEILCGLFENGEWDSSVSYYFLKKTGISDSCFKSNIIAILQNCQISHERLKYHLLTAVKSASVYRKGHLAYFEPLIDGKPTLFGSKLLARIFGLSPDADCSCLLQMVNEDAQNVDMLVEELVFHRIDNERFRLIGNQKEKLPGAENTFVTWFPGKRNTNCPKLETIDLSVDANILWFLSRTGNLSIPGAEETLRLIENTVNSDLILKDPFVVSPYYPNPSIILYIISRGIIFGKLEALYHLKDKILDLNAACAIKSNLEAMCIVSTDMLWGKKDFNKFGIEYLEKGMSKTEAFFVGHFFLGKNRLCFNLSRKPVFQIRYECEALQTAMLLWVKQNLQGSLPTEKM